MAVEKVIVEVGVTGTGDGETKIKSLKAQLKEMKNELLGLDEGSDAFKKLSRDAGELQDKIGDVNDKVNALASDTKNLDALVGAGSAIAGGFQAASGAMAIFGSDSKKVEDAIKNIIAVQGIMNGVQQVSQYLTTKGIIQDQIAAAWKTTLATRTMIAANAQKVWNLVLNQNPLMLLVAGITAVVGAYALFKKSTDGAAVAQEALNEAMAEGDKAAAKEEASIKILTASILSNTTSLNDKYKAIEQLNAISPEYLGNITLENIGTQESIVAIKKYIDSVRAKIEIQALEAQLQEAISERLTITRRIQMGEMELTDGQRLQSLQNEENAILSLIQQRQISNEELDKEVKIKGSLNKAGGDLEKKQTIEKTTTKVEVEFEFPDPEEIEIPEYKDLGFKDIIIDESDLIAEELDLQLEAETEHLSKRQQKLKDFYEQGKITADEYYAHLADSEADLASQTALQNVKKLESFDKYTKAVNDLTTTIFTLTNNLGKQDEASKKKRAERQFNIKKALDMAEAAIDGTKAVLSTFANTPGGLVIKGLAATAAGVFAAAKIAAIGSAKFDGGGTTASVGSVSNAGDSVENVGNTTPNNPIQSGSTFLNQEPQKVYVLESDITKTQGKVAAIEALASFG